MFDLQDKPIAAGSDLGHGNRYEHRWWKPRGPGLRGFVHSVHLLAGAILCVPLALMGLTGSILVFQSELDTLFNPSLHKATATGPGRSASEILKVAKQAAPQHYSPSMLIEPASAGEAAVVRFMADGKGRSNPGRVEVFVDPVSLVILGIRDPSTSLLSQIKLLHANLLVRGGGGRQVAGWLGVVMLALGITGIVTWWPKAGRWRGSILLQGSARGLSLHRNLHRVAGIWGFAVFVIVTFAGVYLAFPQAVGGGIATIMPARDFRAAATKLRVKPVPDSEPIGIDEAVNLASSAVDGKVVRLIGLPSKPNQPIRIALAKSFDADSSSVTTVFVDQWSHTILKIQDPTDYTAGEQFLTLQHSLHSGQGLGWTYKMLVLLCGFLPPLFAFTGINIWWKQRQLRRASASPKRTEN